MPEVSIPSPPEPPPIEAAAAGSISPPMPIAAAVRDPDPDPRKPPAACDCAARGTTSNAAASATRRHISVSRLMNSSGPAAGEKKRRVGQRRSSCAPPGSVNASVSRRDLPAHAFGAESDTKGYRLSQRRHGNCHARRNPPYPVQGVATMNPASTGKFTPVMADACSLARNCTAAAISSAFTSRPKAVDDTM